MSSRLLCSLPSLPRIPSQLDLVGALAALETLADRPDETDVVPKEAEKPVIDKIAEQIFSFLPTWARNACTAWISNIGPDGIRLGSIFSGSDFGLTAVHALLRCARCPSTPMPHIAHVMAVEKVSWKRQWLLTMFPPEVMYTDAADLKEDKPIDAITNQPRPVPGCDVVYIGFSCKSFSALNNDRSSHDNAIENATGSSGETAQFALDYLAKHRPLIALLENVPGLCKGFKSRSADGQVTEDEDSNLGVLLRRLHAIGYSDYIYV